MAGDAPSAAELGRRLVDLSASIVELRTDMARLADRSIRDDVFHLEVSRINKTLDTLEEQIDATADAQRAAIHEAQQNRRFYVASVAIPLLLMLATVLPILLTRH